MKTSEGKTKRTALIYWFFTIGYMGIIFYFSSRTWPGSHVFPYSDKIFHICTYGILAFLSYLSFRKSGVKRYLFLVSFIFAAFYGITDEFHQSYIPGRDVSIGDILADSLGAILGNYSAKVVSGRRLKIK